MKSLSGFLLSSLVLVSLPALDARVGAQLLQPQVSQKATMAKPSPVVRATLGDQVFTFTDRVQLPGLTLAPGTYIFTRPGTSNMNVLAVLSADRLHAYGMFFTAPTYRRIRVDRDQVVVGRAPAAGAPRPIERFDVAGSRMGYEPLYAGKAGEIPNRNAD